MSYLGGRGGITPQPGIPSGRDEVVVLLPESLAAKSISPFCWETGEILSFVLHP